MLTRGVIKNLLLWVMKLGSGTKNEQKFEPKNELLSEGLEQRGLFIEI